MSEGGRRTRPDRPSAGLVAAGALAFLVPVLGCTAGAPVTTAAPSDVARLPRVAFIGDSYTDGSIWGGRGQHNYSAILGEMLTIEVEQFAVGGSGYVAGGEGDETFVERVDAVIAFKPDVIVVLGSRNDVGHEPDDIAAAAASLFGDLRRRTRAPLFVIGPVWVDEKVPTSVRAVEQAVQGAAKASGAEYVDPLDEGWFFHEHARLISSDDVHPTDEGHIYMARLIAPRLRRLLPS